MTLSEILDPAAVRVPLEAADREAAIAALVGALPLGGPGEQQELRDAILAREKAGSTGIGHGIAIPHARSNRIKTPRLALGRAASPIDFLSADGEPVTLVFLLAVPETDPKSHLRTLAALSRLASDKKLLKGLNKAASSEELFGLVSNLPL